MSVNTNNEFWETRGEINFNDSEKFIDYRFGQVPLPIMADFRIDPLEEKIYGTVLTYHLYFGRAFPSQSTIAKMAGKPRETINRKIKEMEKKGLLRTFERGVGQTKLLQVAKITSIYPFLTQEKIKDASYFLDNKNRFSKDLEAFISSGGCNNTSQGDVTIDRMGCNDPSLMGVTRNHIECNNTQDNNINNINNRAEINLDPNQSSPLNINEDPRTESDLNSERETPNQDKERVAPAAPRPKMSDRMADVVNESKLKSSAQRHRNAAQKAAKSKMWAAKGFTQGKPKKSNVGQPRNSVAMYSLWQEEMAKIGLDQSSRKASSADLAKLKRVIDQHGAERLASLVKYACNEWESIKKEKWIFKDFVAPTISILTAAKYLDELFLLMDQNTASKAEINIDESSSSDPWAFVDKK